MTDQHAPRRRADAEYGAWSLNDFEMTEHRPAGLKHLNAQQLRRLVEHLRKGGAVSSAIMPMVLCGDHAATAIIEGSRQLRLLLATHAGKIASSTSTAYNTGNKDWVYNDI